MLKSIINKLFFGLKCYLKYAFIFTIAIFIVIDSSGADKDTHYLAIKGSKINIRYGPGAMYPIKWVYSARGMPMEVLDEFEDWVYLRDIDGDEGWALRRMMNAKHLYAVVREDTVLHNGKGSGRIKARLDRLVFVEVKKCFDDKCKVKIAKTTGWIKKDCLWGIPRKTVGCQSA